ncbi:hypothetical protein DFH07DRAFT_777435, partial [Mycena maculata]
TDLREGAAYDALASVKVVAKALVTLRDRKRKNDSGVYKNTISQKQINDTERRRDLHIAHYMAARQALMNLDQGNASQFPPLEVKDTFLKSRSLRRQLGDSRITDGTVWAQAGISAGPSTASTSGKVSGSGKASATHGTVMPRRQAAQARERSVNHRPPLVAARQKKKGRKDGWLWSFKPAQMTDEELRAWNMEGDRIQWFRAEAEMERWREQVEMKLAEWRTTIRSFARYKDIWTILADRQDSTQIGLIAYAKQKANMFAHREMEGRTALAKHTTLSKYKDIVGDDFDLVAFVTKKREEDKALQNDALKHGAEVAAAAAQRAREREAIGEESDDDDDEWMDEDQESEEDEEEAAEEEADVSGLQFFLPWSADCAAWKDGDGDGGVE